MKHTSGPWFYGVAYEPELGKQPFTYTGPGYYKNPAIMSQDGKTIVGCDEYDVFSDNEYDKMLMVAAPDGLKAAKMAYASLLRLTPEEKLSRQSVLCALRDYIALATGDTTEDVQNRYEQGGKP